MRQVWCSVLMLLLPTAWGQAPPAGLPEAVLQEVADPGRLPPGRYQAAIAWQAEQAGAGHHTGRLIEDPEAEGGRAWEVKEGTDAHGVALFGPYLELAAGDYVALFRIQRLPEELDDALGDIDACVAYGQQVLAGRELEAAELAAGRYVRVPLAFRYPGGKLECRLNWSGFASLRIDSVALYLVEGTDLTTWGRAPAPVPRGEPKDLPYFSEPRPFPDLFPRSAHPADHLWVCDLRSEPPDRRLLLLSLQGLVNRTRPEIYCLYAPLDDVWLDWMVRRKWIKGSRPASPDELLARYRDRVRGMVVTDPRLPASKNVATMIASVEDGVVCSPRLARTLSLPVLADLRGRWQTSAEAYRWAFDQLWPRLNHHVIACSWPDHLGLRDYLVQHRIFIFWISGPLDGARPTASPQAEVELMEELLAKMPVNIPVLSYPWAGKDVGIGEGPGVSLFAEFGKYLVGSIDCANLSVHSGIPAPRLRQKPPPLAPKLEGDKVYLSIILSDGDNLPVLTNGNFPQLWKDPVRGQIPIGWTLSPCARLLIPDIVDYYYRTATVKDHFLGAVSGVGYTYPDLYGQRFRPPDRQRVYDEFLEQTAVSSRASDLRELWIMGATRPEVIARFAERIPFLNALFPDYGRRLLNAEEATYPTARAVPVFHATTSWQMEATREERIAQMVADVRAMTPTQRPAFLHLFALNWFTDLPMLAEVLERLGEDYVAVRPDHLATLYRRWMEQEQVLARFPSIAAAVEGQPITLRGSVRNVAQGEQKVEFSVLAGMDGGMFSPAQVALAPGEEAEVRLSGVATAERIALELRGAFGTRRAEIAVRQVVRAELAEPLPTEIVLSPARFLEAEALPHVTGAGQADPVASGGAIWVARKDEAKPGHAVYGPYHPLEAGRYLALFRLKRLEEGAGLAAVLDTCVGGGHPQTAERRLTADELPIGAWRWFPLLLDHPGGAFEARVLWLGNVSLAVDAIAVWQVES